MRPAVPFAVLVGPAMTVLGVLVGLLIRRC
jgi:hypothetical protein